MADDWRVVEVLKLLRQCVVCPICGSLVATQQGIDSHIAWHDQINEWVAGIESNLQQFSDYIVNPTTGLEKRVTDRLDTITQYVVAPTTGLEPRMTVAITNATAATTQLRTDATTAINQLRTDATDAIVALTARVAALEAA